MRSIRRLIAPGEGYYTPLYGDESAPDIASAQSVDLCFHGTRDGGLF